MKYLLCILILASSCSYKKSNQTLKGHEELYSEPEAPKLTELAPDEKRIVIASTNDLHGNYTPVNYTFKDDRNKEEQSIVIGGESVMSSYFRILRNTYKNVVLVDSGDIFATASSWKDAEAFYRRNNYDAVTVGLRDFNLRVPEKTGTNSGLFQQFAKSSKVPLMLSNLYELKTARVVEWEGTKSNLMKEVDGVKIGIVGLIPDDIVAQTPVNNRVGFFVENMLQSTLRHARLLRSLGADVIVVLTHQGIDCNTELANAQKLPPSKVNFEPKLDNICNLKNVLGEYLERLPPNLVDIVVAGRNHMKTANIVNGMVVMSGFPDGRSFNYSELVINTKTRKLNKEKTVIHQPVTFCHEFFKETSDCYFEDSSVDHKRRIPATFLGEKILPDQAAAAPDTKILKSVNAAKSIAAFNADLSYVPDSTGDTQLFILKLKGHELVKVLEEDYNRDRTNLWQPSPFLMKQGELTVSIGGTDLDLNKTYRILTDLESVQNHNLFVKKVTSYESEALMSYSWNSVEEDQVSSQLAARVR